MRDPRIPAVLAALIAIWGSTWAAIRIGLQGIPPFTGVALRFALAAALLALLARARRIPWQRGRRLHRLWLVETLFGFCISYGVVYWAEQWVPSGLGSVLFATFPLFVALFAHFALPDEPLTALAVAGVLVGFGGVAVLYSQDLAALGGPEVARGAILFLLSPMAAAVGHVWVKKWGEGIHPVNLTIVPMGATGVLMGLIALALEGDRPLVFDARSLGALVYLAVFGSAVTFTLYYWVLARIRATRLSLITYGIPVVALAIGALALGEPITTRTVVGTALVVLGVALATAERGGGATVTEP